MLLTGRTIDAADAATAGFVHAVVPPAEREETAAGLVASLAGMARTPAGLTEIERRPAAAGRAVDADDVLADCYGSTDFQEGVAAFLARRPPRWTGS